MHELSIAISMIELASEQAVLLGEKHVSTLYLKLGLLSGVVKEALIFSYQVACENTILAGSKLVIEEVPVVVYCSKCQIERTLESIQLFSCPVCANPTYDILQGKEIEIVALEFEQ
jgi:hydrogenase nickel incorporation protein HypA/HybF